MPANGNSNNGTLSYANGVNGNGYSTANGSQDNNSSFNYDKLKQELMIEIKKEMQIMKNDIISGKILLIIKKCFFLNFCFYF
jgi:hypothetical protein